MGHCVALTTAFLVLLLRIKLCSTTPQTPSKQPKRKDGWPLSCYLVVSSLPTLKQCGCVVINYLCFLSIVPSSLSILLSSLSYLSSLVSQCVGEQVGTELATLYVIIAHYDCVVESHNGSKSQVSFIHPLIALWRQLSQPLQLELTTLSGVTEHSRALVSHLVALWLPEWCSLLELVMIWLEWALQYMINTRVSCS
jgi:hypothetical protein